jgi:hypothetical protein
MTRKIARVGAVLSAAVLAACGGRTAPAPEPGTIRGLAPDLRGVRVVLLPVQQNYGVAGDPNAELAFGLGERGRNVTWISAAEVEEALARTPGLQTRTLGLPVGVFVQAQVERIGDPLFGELRRIAALVNAEAIVLPVQMAMVSAPGEEPRVRTWTALIDVRSGRVPWFAVLEGGAFPPGDPRALASAVDEISRSLLWYVVN